MIYCFDIDGTICNQVSDGDYSKAEPIQHRIKYINELYEKGNEVIFFTARGTVTKIDWRDLTTNQLQDWNVKYHELIFGKPNADVYVDDKAIKDSNFFNN